MAELKNIRIAVSGIYEYAREEIEAFHLTHPVPVEKSIYRVYRPAVMLEAALDLFKLLPLTHHHPSEWVDGRNFRNLVVGYTGEHPFIDYLEDSNEVGIRSTVMLYDDESLAAYNRGEVQLSAGYDASFIWQEGVSPNGQRYDIIMQEIRAVNHVALLPHGRGGYDARILDNKHSVFDFFKKNETSSVFTLASLTIDT